MLSQNEKKDCFEFRFFIKVKQTIELHLSIKVDNFAYTMDHIMIFTI